jgi:hypothetical protein
MSVNVSIRNYLVTIDGLNCTTAVMEFSGSDTKLDQSGLITFSGSMKLGRPVGFENLDDRINPRWARGKSVLIDIANEANVLARPIRFGTLFISEALYNRSEEQSGRLNLQVVDLLGLLMNKEGDQGKAPKACVGEGGASALSAINQLLTLAGVPAPLLVTDPIPGNINAPANGGGGYIQQAGSIAASQGWFLYIDGASGRVRGRAIDVTQATPISSFSLSANAANFSRLPDKPPAQKMVVNGTGKIVTAIPQTGNTTVSRTFGTLDSIGGSGTGTVLVRERVTTETITGNVQTLAVTVYEALGSLFPDVNPGGAGTIPAEEYVEIHTYEAQNPVTSSGSDCENGNQGRLLSTVITSRKCFGTVYKGLVAIANNPKQGLTGGLTFSPATLQYLTDDYREVTNYQYTPPEIGSGRNLGRGPLITRTKTTQRGVVLADYFSKLSYRPISSSTYTVDVTAEYERQYWWQENSGMWRYEHTLRQSQILAKEGDIARTHKNAKDTARLVDAENYAALVTVEETVTTNNQNNPQSPDVLPPKYEITEKSVSAEYLLPIDSNWDFRDRSQVLTFDYLSGNSVAAVTSQAYALARTWGVIGWGRYRGNMIETNLTNYLHSTYVPADRVELSEDFVSSNLADGFSVGMAGGDLLVSLDLMYLGWVLPPAPATNRVILTLDGLRSIGPADRFDGMIAYNP